MLAARPARQRRGTKRSSDFMVSALDRRMRPLSRNVGSYPRKDTAAIQSAIEGVTIQNSPMWQLLPYYSGDVVIRNIGILAPARSPNTDAIDPFSSSHVVIDHVFAGVGDDNAPPASAASCCFCSPVAYTPLKAEKPPSTGITTPVTKSEAGESNHSTHPSKSLGSPRRPIGVCPTIVLPRAVHSPVSLSVSRKRF